MLHHYSPWLFVYMLVCLGVALNIVDPTPENVREAANRAILRYRIGKIKTLGALYGRPKGN